MKRIKKLASILLAMVMVLGMSMTTFAQTKALEPADADGATITIKNPAKGETYSLHKLFDATVDGNNIAYQGTVPESLKGFFTADSAGYISPTDAIAKKDADGKITGTEMTDDLKAALATWAETAPVIISDTSNGESSLEFTGLPYGYYVVTTTHTSDPTGEPPVAKAAITVTSTQPDADIYDKNVNKPSADKKVEKESYSIGDTVKYTGTFDTTNYIGEANNSKQVVDYVIQDTLPEYLSDVKVTKITIGATKKDDGTLEGGTVFSGTDVTGLQFGTVTVGTGANAVTYEKAILIPWADVATDAEGNVSYTNKYAQGAQIVIEYEAKLTSVTNIGIADTNTISIRPIVVDENSTEKKPWDEVWDDKAEIVTYAAAIKKVDESGQPLEGATFTIKGLSVEAVAGETGVYRVVSYDSAADSTVESAELSTDDSGKLYIVGLASDVKLIVTEFKAPDGYNKLTDTKELTPQLISKEIITTSGERHYDTDGNLVSESSTSTTTKTVTKNLSELDAAALEIVNQRGTLLPSTGGIGTTIFYVVGGILVIGAGILLVAKKRMSNR